ncbi:helix-hairpin-helix domain-containing protein [uncultured Dialister sp.]|nr:helix-hairpin-helix domain-containing protein [uncultured Dialister sp.]
MAYREEHGSFRTKEDLKRVPSISDGKFKKLADKITL